MANKKAVVISVLVVTSLVLLVYNRGKDFQKNHQLTIGTVIGFDQGCGTKGVLGQNIHYQYYADGKLLTDSRRTSELPCDIGHVVIGKSFPVAYRKYWFGYEGAILMIPHDFEIYGHPFPDSLKWMLPFVQKRW